MTMSATRVRDDWKFERQQLRPEPTLLLGVGYWSTMQYNRAPENGKSSNVITHPSGSDVERYTES